MMPSIMRSTARGLRPFARAAGVVALVVMGAASISAQSAPLGGAQRATRDELKTRLATLEAQGGSGRGNTRLQQELSAIRTRLAKGDFQPGDRFALSLRQDSVRSDTLVVRDSLQVAVLNLPDFSVEGLLRSELEERLTAHIARYLRNPSVRATLLTRVSVTGAVTRPGYYYVVPDRPLNDLITTAGGPAGDADVSKLTISRAGRTVVSAKQSKRFVEDGRTLESLDVQSGDTVHIPVRRKINWQLAIQLVFIFTSLLFAFLQFLQWYYGRLEA